MANPQAHYLRDIGPLVKELALEARNSAAAAPDDKYCQGQVFAYYELITLLLDQAVAFNLTAADIGLADFDPERELLVSKHVERQSK